MEQADEILTELAKLGETRTWEPGTAVVTEGETTDCLYIVHSGELRAVVVGGGGRKVELNTIMRNKRRAAPSVSPPPRGGGRRKAAALGALSAAAGADDRPASADGPV